MTWTHWLNAVSRFASARCRRLHRRTRARRIVRPIGLESLEDRTLLATVSWDNGAGNGLWQSPANWSGDVLPGSADDAVIGAGFSATLSSGTQSIRSLTSSSPLVISAGSLSIANASLINNTFTLSGGTLTGAGTLDVAGLLTWSSGTMSGLGVTNANGGLTVSGSGQTHTLDQRTINNVGLATWTAGFFSAGNGAVFNNLSGATLTVQTDQPFNYAFGARSVFNNSGTFRKNASFGVTDFNGTTFNNTGTVDVQTGTLRLGGAGTHSGQLTGSAGTVLEFFSPSPLSHVFQVGANITVPTVRFSGGTSSIASVYNVSGSTTVSAGTVNFNDGIANLGSTFTVSGGTANVNSNPTTAPTSIVVSGGGTANFNFTGTLNTTTVSAGGTIRGPSTMNVSGLLTWNGGTLTGSGSTNANGGISLQAGNGTLDGRTLNNSATATMVFAGGNMLFTNAAVFNNLAGATFNVLSDDRNISGGNGTSVFNNAGTFQKFGVGPTRLMGVDAFSSFVSLAFRNGAVITSRC